MRDKLVGVIKISQNNEIVFCHNNFFLFLKSFYISYDEEDIENEFYLYD